MISYLSSLGNLPLLAINLYIQSDWHRPLSVILVSLVPDAPVNNSCRAAMLGAACMQARRWSAGVAGINVARCEGTVKFPSTFNIDSKQPPKYHTLATVDQYCPTAIITLQPTRQKCRSLFSCPTLLGCMTCSSFSRKARARASSSVVPR